jgi:hypothetical protein
VRIDTSEPSLTALFNKGQVGLIRTEFMRKDDVIANTNELLEIYKKENAALAAENERLRKAAQSVELAFQTLDNGLIETPAWVKQQAMRDAVSQLRAAAKEGRDAK